jgi:mannose-6-phosphate isomerase-like protein (cupin superfamily)
MKKYFKQSSPFVVPTDDGKLIEEHFGNSTRDALSLAHMIAPSGWSEPFQVPDFDEYTYVIRGKKKIIIDGETIILNAGESVRISKGARIQYSNPFKEECEYIAVCLPAFSPDLVNRED